MKTPLLFLCHRIPYPPNKGDKIRSFHLLHHLSQHFDIHLATFVDDPADWPYVDNVRKYCRNARFVELKPWRAKLRSLWALITGEALSIPYYSNNLMQRWVIDCVETNNIKHVIVYSSSMAQFVLDQQFDFERKIVDFVDVDSDKWEQYAQRMSWPLSWLYRREARCLFTYEQQLAQNFDAGLFVSSAEASLFRQLSPASAAKIGYYNNGVNGDYFSPLREYETPFQDGEKAIVFTGAMDYWPNVDAVVWFVREVMPVLRSRLPGVSFYIVGGNPAKTVWQLADEPGVVVTGRVDDVRPYLQYAAAAVAPMRIARGVQNKVLEAMAMARPVLVSSKGLEGIDASHKEQVLVADTVDEYVALLQQVFSEGFSEMGPTARAYVTHAFNWSENLPEVVMLLGNGLGEQRAVQSVSHG